MNKRPASASAKREAAAPCGEPFLDLGEEPESQSMLRLRRNWPYLGVPVFLTLFYLAEGDLGSIRNVFWGLVVFTIITLCFGASTHALYTFVTGAAIRRSTSRVTRLLLHAATMSGSVVLGSEASYWLLHHLPGLPPADIARSALYRVGGVVMAVLWLIEYTYGKLRAHARAVELREERARRDALRAQLEALQARTDPHFLFNSLNTVASLIADDPKLAERALEQLSDLFRYALEGARRKEVRLKEELAAVRAYLEVEGLRFGSRLRFSIDVEEGIDDALMPPLVLQPLVENAVLHGLAPREEGGRVAVRVARRNGNLVLRVEDDGVGPGHSPHRGSGSSLATLRDRLDLAYGSRSTLRTEAAAGGGYLVEVTLPLVPTAAKLHDSRPHGMETPGAVEEP